jgi:hypothetical protein
MLLLSGYGEGSVDGKCKTCAAGQRANGALLHLRVCTEHPNVHAAV